MNLKGEHFTAHVHDGDSVKAGQLLVSFDMEKIQAAGYDTVIPLIFTDPGNQMDTRGIQMRSVKHGDRI